MAIWKKICCAVDFSEPARLALEDAAALAKDLAADLTLLHVCEAAGEPERAGGTVVELQRKLEGWRAEAARLAGRPVHGKVVVGNPVAEIVRFAREERMDAVVVGTHGQNVERHLLLGSVAERVLGQAECTVIVTRRP